MDGTTTMVADKKMKKNSLVQWISSRKLILCILQTLGEAIEKKISTGRKVPQCLMMKTDLRNTLKTEVENKAMEKF